MLNRILCSVMFAVATVAFAFNCCGSTAQTQIDFWQKVLDEPSFNQRQLSERLENPSAPPWPLFVSLYAITQQSDSQARISRRSQHLAETLHAKIGTLFSRTTKPSTFLEAEAEVDFYCRLAEAVGRPAGYGNLLLQSAAFDLAFYRAACWIATHSEQTNQATTLLAKFHLTKVSLKELLIQLSDQDSFIQAKRGDLWKIQDNQNVYTAMSQLGISLYDVERAGSSGGLHTGDLLKNPSVLALVKRLASTEMQIRVRLAGTARFFAKGGTLDEINPKDIRAFDARMGSSAKEYAYPLLGVKEFNSSAADYLIRLNSENSVGGGFLAIALD